MCTVGVADGSIEIFEDFCSDSTPTDRFVWLHSFHEHTHSVTKIEGEELPSVPNDLLSTLVCRKLRQWCHAIPCVVIE